MPFVDLHAHTTASDGENAPADLVRRAAEVGLAALAVTDHDTVAGVDEAMSEADRIGIELIPGVEISVLWPGREDEFHVLGLLIDHHSDAITRMNRLLQEARSQRNDKLIAKLDELGVPVGREELEAVSDGIISRAHFAELMVRHRYVRSYEQAFEKYIGPGGLAYYHKGRLTLAQAIETIHDAGGVAVLAHPVHYPVDHPAEMETLVGRMVDAGLDGIEAFHPDHSPDWVRRVQTLADRFDLCITGGSDYHGPKRVGRHLNCQRVDVGFLDRLKQRRDALRQTAASK
jgi:hypothetical protein